MNLPSTALISFVLGHKVTECHFIDNKNLGIVFQDNNNIFDGDRINIFEFINICKDRFSEFGYEINSHKVSLSKWWRGTVTYKNDPDVHLSISNNEFDVVVNAAEWILSMIRKSE